MAFRSAAPEVLHVGIHRLLRGGLASVALLPTSGPAWISVGTLQEEGVCSAIRNSCCDNAIYVKRHVCGAPSLPGSVEQARWATGVGTGHRR